jgi:predicted Fe-S protein YdhL (DUF1289 family)
MSYFRICLRTNWHVTGWNFYTKWKKSNIASIKKKEQREARQKARRLDREESIVPIQSIRPLYSRIVTYLFGPWNKYEFSNVSICMRPISSGSSVGPRIRIDRIPHLRLFRNENRARRIGIRWSGLVEPRLQMRSGLEEWFVVSLTTWSFYYLRSSFIFNFISRVKLYICVCIRHFEFV